MDSRWQVEDEAVTEQLAAEVIAGQMTSAEALATLRVLYPVEGERFYAAVDMFLALLDPAQRSGITYCVLAA